MPQAHKSQYQSSLYSMINRQKMKPSVLLDSEKEVVSHHKDSIMNSPVQTAGGGYHIIILVYFRMFSRIIGLLLEKQK